MGRKSGNIFRTTISVPIKLRKRMDAIGEQVNWSAVACEAFERKLAEVARMKGSLVFDRAIQQDYGCRVSAVCWALTCQG